MNMPSTGSRFRCLMTERAIGKLRAASLDVCRSRTDQRTARLLADVLTDAYAELRSENPAVDDVPSGGSK